MIPCRWRKLDHPEGAVCTSPHQTTEINGDTLYTLLQPWTCEKCPFPDHRPVGEPVRITTHGPGTELKRLLRLHGINPDEAGCQCNARAADMDERGPEWCEANIETIVGWLKEESDRRGWPFVAWYARLLVRRAIKAARTSSLTTGTA